MIGHSIKNCKNWSDWSTNRKRPSTERRYSPRTVTPSRLLPHCRHRPVGGFCSEGGRSSFLASCYWSPCPQWILNLLWIVCSHHPFCPLISKVESDALSPGLRHLNEVCTLFFQDFVCIFSVPQSGTRSHRYEQRVPIARASICCSAGFFEKIAKNISNSDKVKYKLFFPNVLLTKLESAAINSMLSI